MRRSACFFVAAVVIWTAGSSRSGAADFPKHPIEMVIPFGAGGASDIFARQYAMLAEKHIGKPITSVNKGAAGTIEGTTYAFNQPADGYTILEITPSVLIIEALKKTPIAFRDNFEPLLRVQSDLQLIGVAKKSTFKSFKELADFAKANPKKLKIGGLSPGGLDDYIANGLAQAAGFVWVYVPYKSGSEVKAAVLGGELDVYQDKLISFLPLVESGDIVPLLVLNAKRLDKVPALKNVPCSVELGANFTQGSWRGFAVKKGTPPEIKQIIITALQKAYDDPGYKAMEEKEMTNLVPGYARADEFRKIWDDEYKGYVEVFKRIGLLK
jgi:putative tricarboxylic transport membrane protein